MRLSGPATERELPFGAYFTDGTDLFRYLGPGEKKGEALFEDCATEEVVALKKTDRIVERLRKVK